MYESRKSRGDNGNSGDDWYCAELQLIREVFDRHAESDLTVRITHIARSQRLRSLSARAVSVAPVCRRMRRAEVPARSLC